MPVFELNLAVSRLKRLNCLSRSPSLFSISSVLKSSTFGSHSAPKIVSVVSPSSTLFCPDSLIVDITLTPYTTAGHQHAAFTCLFFQSQDGFVYCGCNCKHPFTTKTHVSTSLFLRKISAKPGGWRSDHSNLSLYNRDASDMERMIMHR